MLCAMEWCCCARTVLITPDSGAGLELRAANGELEPMPGEVWLRSGEKSGGSGLALL